MWADDDNAASAAEAQSFKRACSCFGLGRYLYYFIGTWVDLDDRKRPKTVPKLDGWATPEGWRRGFRPTRRRIRSRPSEQVLEATAMQWPAQRQRCKRPRRQPRSRDPVDGTSAGKRRYRGLLKTLARVWNPKYVQDPASNRRCWHTCTPRNGDSADWIQR
jgi:hypothetical protein